MNQQDKPFLSRSVLILNKPHAITNEYFYTSIFRIPEVLRRLLQYREILKSHNLDIPLWAYGLIQDSSELMRSFQYVFVNFVISIGLLDRYIQNQSWPQYIIGSADLIDVVFGKTSFENQISTYLNNKTLKTNQWTLQQITTGHNDKSRNRLITANTIGKYAGLKDSLEYFKNNKNKNNTSYFKYFTFKLLNPHNEETNDQLEAYDLFSQEFLEWDQDLKWLWPVWKKAQIKSLKNKSKIFS